MEDLINNPTTTGIATGVALGVFAGGAIAWLTGHDDQIEHYAARGSVVGGFVGILLELSTQIGRAIGPLRALGSRL